MNPFDEAPSGPAAPLDPPSPLVQPPSRRRRTALVALAAAGLMGVGVVGISRFASAERAGIAPRAGDEVIGAPTADAADAADTADPAGGDDLDRATVEDEFVIHTGDGDPILIDLGDGTVDGRPFERIAECLGFDGEFHGMFDRLFEDAPFGEPGRPGPMGGMPFGELGLFGSDGTLVAVIGPNGVSVVDLGDGDGSVTVRREDGSVTIETDGSATVTELGEMLGGIDLPALGDLGDLGDLDIGELLPEDFPFELPDDLQACLDDAG